MNSSGSLPRTSRSVFQNFPSLFEGYTREPLDKLGYERAVFEILE